jgi:hypothetical protein
MQFVRHAAKAALAWAAANPVKAAQLAVAVAIIGATLVKTRQVDTATLKRAMRVLI